MLIIMILLEGMREMEMSIVTWRMLCMLRSLWILYCIMHQQSSPWFEFSYGRILNGVLWGKPRQFSRKIYIALMLPLFAVVYGVTLHGSCSSALMILKRPRHATMIYVTSFVVSSVIYRYWKLFYEDASQIMVMIRSSLTIIKIITFDTVLYRIKQHENDSMKYTIKMHL